MDFKERRKIDVDALYRRLGRPGRFQIAVYLMLCCNYFPVVLNHLVMAMFGARTEYTCDLTEDFLNHTAQRYGDSVEVTADRCTVTLHGINESNLNMTQRCPTGWKYHTSTARESNIITEWNLTCDDAYLSNLATTIYFCGVMLGGLIFGSLSDRWGRKPFMLLALYMHIVVGVGIAFAQNYLMFVALRFIMGILMQGLQTCSFVLIMEWFTPEHRTVVGTVFEIFWGTGVMWLALVSWLVQDWRYIQLVLTLPSILTIIYIWTIPESIRWLVANGKFKRAESVLHVAAKFNQVEISDDPFGVRKSEIDEVPVAKPPAKKYNVTDMFKTPKLRKRSLVLFYVWLVTACNYYGLSLSITSLAGNKYLNFFIGGAVELPAYCAAVFILNRFGRQKPLCVYMLIGGVFCISAGLVPTKIGGYSLPWLPTTLALIGRFGMAGSFSVILLFTCELYPTVIRNVSMGACAFWTRVGGVIAPQILLLGKYTLREMPVIVFGVMALLAGVLALLLPETLNKNLPDTIEQAENIKTEQNYNAQEKEMDPIDEILLNDSKQSEVFI